MLFQIYGETAGFQLLGWLLVFVGLILANEFARRTKVGGIICFLAIPAALTVYFISIYVGAAMGAEWALNNPTYVYMNGWFHYFKLYAATAGCIGFMMIKYQSILTDVLCVAEIRVFLCFFNFCLFTAISIESRPKRSIA